MMESTEEMDCRVNELKSWLHEQPHLPHDVCDNILRSFVHGSKSQEDAKQRLDSYFTIRNRYPELFSFSSRDPLNADFRESTKSGYIFYLPKPTAEGYRVVMNIVTEHHHLFDHRLEIIRNMMLLELGMYFWPDMTGIMFVYDLKWSSKVVPKFSFAYSRAVLQWFQGTFPLKMKRALVFNSPPIFSIFFNTIIRRFMKAKLVDRITLIAGDDKFLKDHIQSDLLPSDYGGQAPSIEELNNHWLEILVQQRDWFRKTSTQVTDETKRAGRPSRINVMFHKLKNSLHPV